MHDANLIAFDVGGTKTDAVLFSPDGKIISHLYDRGANPLDLGRERARDIIFSVTDKLYAAATAPVVALYGGIACVEYFGDTFQKYFAERYPNTRVRIEGDGPALISGVLGHRDGAGFICGTGSALYVRKNGVSDHIGGYGYLIDSCGSGFILGKKALLAVVKAHDGRKPATILSDLISEKLGIPVMDALPEIYQKGRPFIASFAQCVFAARAQGDEAANDIFNACAHDLAELVREAARRMGGDFDLVMNGGIFAHFPEYVRAVAALSPQTAHMRTADKPPVYGGAVEAMFDAALPLPAAFSEKFI